MDIDKLVQDIIEYNGDIYYFPRRDDLWNLSNDLILWNQWYEKIKPYANNGNMGAIITLYDMSYRHIPGAVTKYELRHYLSKVPNNKIQNFLSTQSVTSVCDYIVEIIGPLKEKADKIDKMEEEIRLLKKENDNMRMKIDYMPGGNGYCEAKREFNKLAIVNDKIEI